ncbi:MFS general substrate transporter [Phanerochaete sordida]|uniref:MFS general substrate transporter n=1 Tax=Phanerochaete sordida TaxID=48140 RepID=A0A9P3GB75_9APHY|nr:MFS general substrate transporter [Phanerochaete sordida]
MASVVGTQLVQMVAFGGGINAGLVIPARIGETSVAATAWIAASYPLTQGAFILPGGRLGAIYGHHSVLFVGALLWVAFTIGSGFAPSFVALCALRACAGVGGGVMVPNCVALLCITFPPGKMRNIALGLFGATAPIGAAVHSGRTGSVMADWEHRAILGFVVFGIAFMATPRDSPMDPNGKVDIIGASLGVSALFLFNFVWNQASVVGWPTVYEYVLLIVSLLCVAGFIVWEARFAEEPILPLSIWTRPSFSAIGAVVVLSLMGFGIFLWYTLIWQYDIRKYTPTAVGATLVPFILVSSVMAFVSAQLVRRIRIEFIMALGIGSLLVANVIVATMPTHEVYWAQVMPANIIAGAGPDLLITAAQIIASNSVRRSEQGVAGSLIGVLQFYGLSTGLGFAGTVESQVNEHGRNPVKGYRGALFLAVGFCTLALAINFLFVRMPADMTEGWNEDDLKSRESGVPKEKEGAKPEETTVAGV